MSAHYAFVMSCTEDHTGREVTDVRDAVQSAERTVQHVMTREHGQDPRAAKWLPAVVRAMNDAVRPCVERWWASKWPAYQPADAYQRKTSQYLIVMFDPANRERPVQTNLGMDMDEESINIPLPTENYAAFDPRIMGIQRDSEQAVRDVANVAAAVY
jgi:hypothetical protein